MYLASKAGELITAPGIYRGMSSTDYHADPCPAPALSQSCAKTMVANSPLHAWHEHPRLNPEWEPSDPTKFDVGNCAHKLMLGRGKDFMVCDFDNWMTKIAKETRADAVKNGITAILRHKYERAVLMVAAARQQLEIIADRMQDRGNPLHARIRQIFCDGDAEAVLAWQDDGGIWCRQMLDWITPDGVIVADYKTTDIDAQVDKLGRIMFDAGWHIQAAQAERGLDVLHPAEAGRRHYFFVLQEASEPFQVHLCEVTEGPLSMGRKVLAQARQEWRTCLAADNWPGYPRMIQTPSLPPWAETKELEREVAFELTRTAPAAEHMMGG